MDPGASDREEELLAATLSKLNDQQKALYEKQLLVFEERGNKANDTFRLAVAAAIAKDMPARYTANEIRDITGREERRQQDDAIRQASKVGEMSQTRAERLQRLYGNDDSSERENRQNDGKGLNKDRDSGDRSR